MNSLITDFQTFVNHRLERIEQKLLKCSEYQRETANIEKLTQKLQAAMSPNLAINLQDIDDSNAALINMYQNASYRLGFRDALRLIAEL